MSAGAAWPDFVWCFHDKAIPVSRARLYEQLEKKARQMDPGTLKIIQAIGGRSGPNPLVFGDGLLFWIGSRLIPYRMAEARIRPCPPLAGAADRAWPDQMLIKDFSLCLVRRNEDWVLQGSNQLPLYINGKRMAHLAALETNCWIFAGGLLLVRLGSLLFSSLPLEGLHPAGNLLLCQREEKAAGRYEAARVPAIQHFHIESLDEPASQSGMTPASPAGMIVISSLASVLSGFLLNPSNPASYLATLLSAGISAAGFCGWYGWNGHRQKSRTQQQRTEKVLTYLDYLKKQMEEIERERQRLLEEFRQERSRILEFDEGLHGAMAQQQKWMLPAAMESRPFADLEFPPLGWQLESTAACKALDQLKSQNLQVLCVKYVEFEGVYDLSGWSGFQLEWLWMLWAWMAANENRRFAWIGIKPALPLHPCSQLAHQPLYFDSWKEFEACTTSSPAIEWTICSALCWPSASLIQNQTVLALWPDNPGEAIVPLFEDQPVPKWIFRKTCFLPIFTSANRSAFFPCCLEKENSQDWKQKRASLSLELAPGVFWNLKSEGPHALVAGATGSGKSEGLCTMLFQLTFQNSARFLQYVLIDFKGGSFCMPFADLPHTAAVLTNLDKAQIKRLEKALCLELERRQEALSVFLQANPGVDTGIENCPDPADGLPFSEIVVCVDEFGQLKSRYPDFMKNLQEMARIGRSLGFHLILCTQKPAGLVDEQIWANSRSRLCFAVLDKADSREVLGHDGAARLKHSGEFFLQCGQESEKRGRAFYLKTPASGKGDIRELKSDGTWSRIEQPSLQDALRRQILSRNERTFWILHPDLNESDGKAGLMEDKLSCFEAYDLKSGENLLLAAGTEEKLQSLAMALAASSALPVFAAWKHLDTNRPDKKDGTGTQEQPVPDQPDLRNGFLAVEYSALWQLADSKWKQPVLVLLRLETNVPAQLIEALAGCSWITLVLGCLQLEFRQEKLLALFPNRMYAGMESRDILAQISEGKLTETENWPVAALRQSGMAKHEYRRLILNRPDKCPWQSKDLLRQAFLPVWLKPDLLALDQPHLEGLAAVDAKNGKPVCMDGKPLTIAWSAPAFQDKAQSLVLRLQVENPLLDLSARPGKAALCLLDLNQTSDPAGMLTQAADWGNILFAGPGFSSYGYLLQLQLPIQPTGDALWISAGQVKDCFIAGVDLDD